MFTVTSEWWLITLTTGEPAKSRTKFGVEIVETWIDLVTLMIIIVLQTLQSQVLSNRGGLF